MEFRKYFLPLIPILGFFLLWQFLADHHLINNALFPAPSAICTELILLYKQQIAGNSVLMTNIVITLIRLLYAALMGMITGILAGTLMGLNRRFYRFFDPVITLIMPIPGIAMAPIFIIWMGFGDPTIITVGAIATFFPVACNTCTGVRSTDMQMVRAARIMGASNITILTNVYLPWAAIYIFTGIKLGLARCWRTVIAVEFIAAANWGLGYMIWDAAEYLRAGLVYGGIILLALIFITIEKGVIGLFERMTIKKWGMVRN